MEEGQRRGIKRTDESETWTIKILLQSETSGIWAHYLVTRFHLLFPIFATFFITVASDSNHPDQHVSPRSLRPCGTLVSDFSFFVLKLILMSTGHQLLVRRATL